MHDLTLEVGEIDLIVIAQRDVPHTARSEIETDRRAKPARADHQRSCRKQLLLPLDADLG